MTTQREGGEFLCGLGHESRILESFDHHLEEPRGHISRALHGRLRNG